MSALTQALWVLLLGSLLGLELIGKVPPTLHTPLMSGANAISGITVLASLTLIAQANGQVPLLLLGSLSLGFALFNVVGAVLWVAVCAGAGYAFGNIPVVKDNFELVVLGIVGVSVLPLVFEVMRSLRASR